MYIGGDRKQHQYYKSSLLSTFSLLGNTVCVKSSFLLPSYDLKKVTKRARLLLLLYLGSGESGGVQSHKPLSSIVISFYSCIIHYEAQPVSHASLKPPYLHRSPSLNHVIHTSKHKMKMRTHSVFIHIISCSVY